MYNTDLPRRADLPTSGQLLRSTVIAAAAAAAILVTIVLPSEYAVDPTGVGRVLGLTQIGEIKVQLAEEAAQAEAALAAAPALDTAPSVATTTPPVASPANATAAAEADTAPPVQEDTADRLTQMEALLAQIQAERSPQPASPPDSAPQVEAAPLQAPVAPAPSQEPIAAAPETVPAAIADTPAVKSDEMSITLAPGEGAEVKLEMRAGARAIYRWSASGEVNFDAHGDGGGESISYNKGRGVPADEGTLEAAFDGNHGWFWRNRGQEAVTLTLQTSGDYVAIKRLI